MRRFSIVCCINRPEIAQRCLLASPCVQADAGHQLILVGQASSAGDGMRTGLSLAKHEWLVMVHQDVYLPAGWDLRFGQALDAALALHAHAAVVGVYGVQADGTHVGYVHDRDHWMGAPVDGASPVRSLDELLVAVRVSSGLCPSPSVGWHLYGTDLCLAAEARRWEALVIDGPCEHRSTLPRVNEAADAATRQQLRSVVEAYGHSAQALLQRWPHATPIHTPVMPLNPDFSIDNLLTWVDQP